MKAYTTRVGGGPFPTELHDEIGDRLRKAGAEFGSVTGRPRRTGWLDLPALRYAVRVNGIDGIALTKLDVLSGHDELKVCVAYKTAHGVTQEFPIDELDTATPVYESMPGWSDSTEKAQSLADLPKAARAVSRSHRERHGLPARCRERRPATGRDDHLASSFRVMVFRLRNAFAMLVTCACAIACSSTSTAPAPYVPPTGDRVTEQTDGMCPSTPNALRGTVAVGGACTEGADCAPVCCTCTNGTNRSWLGVHCKTSVCVGAPDVCADTANPSALCAKPQ